MRRCGAPLRLCWRGLRALVLLLAGLLLVAWLVVHWAILPRVDGMRPWLEREATKVLGVPLRIGSLKAESGGWMPALELRDVQLLDRTGPGAREALRLPRVSAVLSVQSLLVWEPRFAQLLIDAPEVEIRRDRTGRIFIAGLDVEGAEKAEASGAGDAWEDWFFSQPELWVRNGRLRWLDERRAAQHDSPPAALELDGVNLLLRNGLQRHQFRLDATPPAAWGERFSLRGQFRQQLLKRPGDLSHWRGELFMDLPRTDLRELRRHVDLPFDLREGDGAVRAWVDVQAGQPAAATVDLGLRAVRLRLLDGAPELQLNEIEGRVELSRVKDKLSLQARRLGFVSGDGIVWPRSDWGVSLQMAPPKGQASAEVLGGEVNAQRLDFALMAQIAQRLPLGERSYHLLASLQPEGVLTELHGSWLGPLEAPRQYRVAAHLEGLALTAGTPARPGALGRPGVRGASLQLEATEQGGQARLVVRDGRVELPGLFEDPLLPIHELQTRLHWRLPQPGDKQGAYEFALQDLKLQTPDARGEFELRWHRARDAAGPGTIDLSGQLDGLAAARVARYMPLSLPATRSYLSRALLAGEAEGVSVRLKGPLAEFPYTAPGSAGVFRVATQARGVSLAYVPPAPDGTPSNWPPFERIDGELIFERDGMQIRNARARMLGYEVSGVNGGIAHFGAKAQLQLDGQGKGQLTDLLRFVRGSPLDGWLSHALGQAVASGPSTLKLGVQIPLWEGAPPGTVKGQVQLAGVELRLRPDVPHLSDARARIDFDERSVQLSGGGARLLGGEVSIDGGSQKDGSLRFGIQGQASSEALRQAAELGPLAQLASAMKGQTAYRFQLAMQGGQSEVSFASNLQGMALDLPAPLRKEADAALPLRWLQVPIAAGRDEIRVELGASSAPLLQAQLQRDTTTGRALRGAIAVQDKLPALPPSGIAVQLQAASLDLDAWQAQVARWARQARMGAATEAAAAAPDLSWLPQQVNLRSRQLRLDGRQLSGVAAQISRNPDASVWRLQLDAEQLAGLVELRGVQFSAPAEVAEVHARLSRLSLPRQDADTMSARATELLDREGGASFPALDIVVDDFELKGKRLGRLELQARVPGRSSGARDWQLDRIEIKSPDATLHGQGSWAAPRPGSPRRTELELQLDIADAGRLLARLGQPATLRGGKGSMSGHINWDGSPLAFNYPSLGGELKLQLDSGTFLKAEPGVARLLGVLSLQSLPRRLLLDFRDVFADGFVFDGVTADVHLANGVARSDNIRIRGVQAAVLVDGSSDLAAETQVLRVVVVPEINAGGASLAYAAINPAVALTTFLAQLVFSRPMAAANTREFHITGTWSEPKVERVERIPEAVREAARAASAPPTPSTPASAP